VAAGALRPVFCLPDRGLSAGSLHSYAQNRDGESLEAGKALWTGKSYCWEQLTKFCDKVRHIYEKLGPSAANCFILESSARLERIVDIENQMVLPDRRPARDGECDYGAQSLFGWTHLFESVSRGVRIRSWFRFVVAARDRSHHDDPQ